MTKYCLLIIFLGFNLAFAKIKLSNIDALTFRFSEMTTGRRSAPLPQLKCTGACSGSPKTIQCKNIGTDGIDVQWDCTTDLPNNLKFGIVNVNCEGFDFPNDPFILEGSCQLQYELMYKNNVNYSNLNEFVCFIIVIFCTLCICNRGGGGGYGYGGGGGYGYGGGGRGGGFWSGLGIGALAGNAFGGRRRRWGGGRHRGGGGRHRGGGGSGSRTVRTGAKTTRR